MKFCGIDMKGVFKVPRVTLLPTYVDTLHGGSIYYQETDENFYFGISGVNGGWGKIVMDISLVTDRIDIIENNIDTIEASVINIQETIDEGGEIDVTLTVTPALKKSSVL